MNRFCDRKIILALLLVIAGGIMALVDCYYTHTPGNVMASIGCSLLASAGVCLLQVWLIDAKKKNPLDEWNIDKIYETRSEKGKDSDPKLSDVQYQFDGIAFGLKSFRAKHQDKVYECLRRGVNVRLLVMAPDSPYAAQRDNEEGDEPGHLKNSINQLVNWADELNTHNLRGKITIKGYHCMTLDFYWRIDGEIYVGPYWYGIPSQQTITYKFVQGGKGFTLYANYFEGLWNNAKLTNILTKE